jgi:glycosyltransferase involved in cell wall biosynthesis
MRVSVIIPVYNAANYIQQAVESALAQPETGEVILIEDGSPDHSLAICQELAVTHPIVHLYRHPNGENRGAAASRNLGICKSTCEYIAFLDADDFYLSGRFSVAREFFAVDPELEGVYEALGEHIESKAAAQRWDAGRGPRGLTTMTKKVSPDQLFETLVPGGNGHFHLNCLVVRRTVFDKTGLFDEPLRLAQDTAMIWKMASVARLAPGRLDQPVAMRRIHEYNRCSALSPQERRRVWLIVFSTVWRWSRKNVDEEKRQVVLERFLNYAVYSRLKRAYPRWTHGLQKKLWLGLLLLRCPLLALEPYFWERFIPQRVARLWERLVRGWKKW